MVTKGTEIPDWLTTSTVGGHDKYIKSDKPTKMAKVCAKRPTPPGNVVVRPKDEVEKVGTKITAPVDDTWGVAEKGKLTVRSGDAAPSLLVRLSPDTHVNHEV